MSRRSNDELEDIYGYCGHRCVLFANSKGEVIPGDFVWFHIEGDSRDGYRYDDMRPVAIVISHSSDKYYHDNLQEALLIPSSWDYEIVWRDEDWFGKYKGLLVRHLGWQDGMRGGVTTKLRYRDLDEVEYEKGYDQGRKHKIELAEKQQSKSH